MLAKLLHEHGHSVNTPTIGQLLTAAHRNTQLGLSQTHLQYNGWSPDYTQCSIAHLDAPSLSCI